MANINETNYLAITAMLAARTSGMLSAERLERMIAAPTDDEAVKVLEECGYGDLTELSADARNDALENRLAEIFDEVERIVPEPELVQMFRLKYDFHNIKTVIKSHGAGVGGGEILSRRGSIPAQVIEEAFVSDDYIEIPSSLAEPMQEAASILARTSNPQLADFALDRAYFDALTKLVQDLSDEGFSKAYVKLMIDSANLRSAVRTNRMGKESDFLSLALVPGGEIGVASVLAADSGEALAELYRPTRLTAAAEAGSAAMNGGSLTVFERTCDNALMDYVREAKIMRFGAAHVVSYLAAMENEVTAARMILSGRMAGLKADTIRERMREAYA